MTEKIPCEIIRDLLPSYVDGLTSETTNQAVENHVSDCTDCKTALDFMREGEKENEKTDEKKEIDFLKKTRRRKTQAVVIGVLTAVVILFSAIIAKVYFIGSDIDERFVGCNVVVEDKRLSVNAWSMSDSDDIPFVHFEEKDGTVTVSFKSVVKSRFHRNGCMTAFTAENKITRVLFDDRIVWDDGAKISRMTSDLFKTQHPYVGDMPKNSETAYALCIRDVLGSYSNALKTSEEPYAWTLVLEQNQSKDKEKYMREYAYVILALIDNLSEVRFEYEIDGKPYVLCVDTEEASDFADSDIKSFGKEISKLQKLVSRTFLIDEDMTMRTDPSTRYAY